MKKNLFLLAILFSFVITLNSCITSSIATVSSSEVKKVNSTFCFENDTVKISYKFWAKYGTMTFDVYNKTNKQLYFDWKKSAFIPNDKMMSYWQDETNTTGITSASGYYLFGNNNISAVSKLKSIKQERIGVVPPRSMITSNKYNIVPPKSKFELNKSFDINSSPLRFRNFLTLSFSEQFDKDVFYVDNSFFISIIEKVNEMKIKNFQSDATFYIN